MSLEKEDFLRTKLVGYLQRLDPFTPPQWGKMNVQQMIEHYSNEGLRIANGTRRIDTILTPPEKLGKVKEFMMSEKPFKENTKNRMMNDEPEPLKHKTVQSAIGELHQELITFFEMFEQNPEMTTRNPFFGDLNFEENVQLLYKHALHHLRQFGVVPLNS